MTLCHESEHCSVKKKNIQEHIYFLYMVRLKVSRCSPLHIVAHTSHSAANSSPSRQFLKVGSLNSVWSNPSMGFYQFLSLLEISLSHPTNAPFRPVNGFLSSIIPFASHQRLFPDEPTEMFFSFLHWHFKTSIRLKPRSIRSLPLAGSGARVPAIGSLVWPDVELKDPARAC